MTDLLPHITLETGPHPRHSIIWLHGLGADGEDFVPIAEEMELPVAVRYVFPHAPMQPVTLNGGYVMRAWYDIAQLADASGPTPGGDRQEDESGIRASQREIERLIAQERQRGIPARAIILAGFSQGGAIALHTGLRQRERLGGILALSTYLPLPGTLAAEAGIESKHTPLFMAHGLDDPIVPCWLGKLSATQLTAQGYAPEWHEYRMPHAVCPEEVRDIEHWLAQRMGA